MKTSPVPLNTGERLFVKDLQRFYEGNPGFFQQQELYFLCNLSRGRGVGFFEAGNFHPDFILWSLNMWYNQFAVPASRWRFTYIDRTIGRRYVSEAD